MSETGFYVGQEVVTRRGKRGIVTAVSAESIRVRFGGAEFDMKPGQLVSARSYDRRGPAPTWHK